MATHKIRRPNHSPFLRSLTYQLVSTFHCSFINIPNGMKMNYKLREQRGSSCSGVIPAGFEKGNPLSRKRPSMFFFPPLARSAWSPIRRQPANQHSEQQGMVLVHMGTRPARAQLICMARTWLATLSSPDQSCQSNHQGAGLIRGEAADHNALWCKKCYLIIILKNIQVVAIICP